MRTLVFEADGQKLKKSSSCDFSNIAKGSKGYLEAKFELSKDWDDCLIAASFFRWGKEYAQPVIDGKCTIPPAALVGNEFYVQITGLKNGQKIPTNKVRVEQEG